MTYKATKVKEKDVPVATRLGLGRNPFKGVIPAQAGIPSFKSVEIRLGEYDKFKGFQNAPLPMFR